MNWTWQFEDVDGKTVAARDTEFSNQGDAESWLGEEWRELAESGAAVAILHNGETVEYRMPLTPEEG